MRYLLTLSTLLLGLPCLALELQLTPAPVVIEASSGLVPDGKARFRCVDGKSTISVVVLEETVDEEYGIPKALYTANQLASKDALGQGTLYIFASAAGGTAGIAIYKTSGKPTYLIVGRWTDEPSKELILKCLKSSRPAKAGETTQTTEILAAQLRKFQEEVVRISRDRGDVKPDEFGRLVGAATKDIFTPEQLKDLSAGGLHLMVVSRSQAAISRAIEECKTAIEAGKKEVATIGRRMQEEDRDFRANSTRRGSRKKDDTDSSGEVGGDKKPVGDPSNEGLNRRGFTRDGLTPDPTPKSKDTSTRPESDYDKEKAKKSHMATLQKMRTQQEAIQKNLRDLSTASTKLNLLSTKAGDLLEEAAWTILNNKPLAAPEVFTKGLGECLTAYCNDDKNFGATSAVAEARDVIANWMGRIKAEQAALAAAKQRAFEEQARAKEAAAQAEALAKQAEADRAKAELEKSKLEAQRKAEEAKAETARKQKAEEEAKKQLADLLANGPAKIQRLEADCKEAGKQLEKAKAKLAELEEKLKEADAAIVSCFTDRQRNLARLRKAELVEEVGTAKGAVSAVEAQIVALQENLKQLKADYEKAKQGSK